MSDKKGDCPVCGEMGLRLFEKYGHWIRGCKHCKHRYVENKVDAEHLQEVYGDSYFTGGGAGYRDYCEEGELLRERGHMYAKLVLPHVSEPGTLLDVGAAAGFVLQGWLDAGWMGCGLEPNETMVDYACNTLGLDVSQGSLESYASEQRFRLISMIQVVAHFYDLRRAFQRAAELTAPEGYWLVETWDCQSWTARLFGQHWHEYSPPSVLHYFSRQSLSTLAKQFGFHEVASGQPRRWIRGSHIRSLLQYKMRDTVWGRRLGSLVSMIPSGVAFPYWGDDLFWMLFRREP